MKYLKLGALLVIGICAAVAIHDYSAGSAPAPSSQQANAVPDDNPPPQNPAIDAAAAGLAAGGAAASPPATSTGPSPPPPDYLSVLLPCAPSSGEDCTNDIFQKVWVRIEADNGEITKVDTRSIEHSNLGSADIAVYTFTPGTPFDVSRMRRLLFDCTGQYRDVTDGSSPVMDAPPRSVAGQISSIACAGAKDTRMQDMDRDTGAGESPAD